MYTVYNITEFILAMCMKVCDFAKFSGKHTIDQKRSYYWAPMQIPYG